MSQISHYHMFSPKWEVFGRYEYIRFDGKTPGFAAGTDTNVHDLTAGVNYYMYGHGAKLTMDVSYLPNGTPVSDTGSDVLSDNGGKEFLARIQIQLLI